MRHGRSKAARRTLQFFRRTIDLNPPYHVILDGTFLVAVLRYQLQDEIRDRIAKLLQLDPLQLSQQPPRNNHNRTGNHQPNQQQLFCHVTRSSLQELQTLLTSLQESSKKAEGDTKEQIELMERARKWGLDESDEVLESIASQSDEVQERPPTPVSKAGGRRQKSQESTESSLSLAAQDILRFVQELQGSASASQGVETTDGKSNKKNRRSRIYLVASQDEQLLHHLRRVGRVPCLHLARGGVLLLESPSHVAVDMAQREESAKWNGKTERLEMDDESTDPNGERPASFQPQQKRVLKRKAKGPNPLSCKKKKVESPKQPSSRPTTTTKNQTTTFKEGVPPTKPPSRRKRRKTSGSGEGKGELMNTSEM